MEPRWDSVPNCDDRYAKVRKCLHSPSGAWKVEVLYGARDVDGRPTEPRTRSDGHGHWIALEIEGAHQVHYWRRPAYQGGTQEYGSGDSENALNELESDIRAKEAICLQAERLANSSDWRDASIKLSKLFDEWRQIYHWHTPKENELWERFKSVRSTFYDRRNAGRESNKIAKRRAIAEAKILSESSDWKAAGDRLGELLEEWKRIGHAGKDEDDALWVEFNEAWQRFFDRRRKHYRQLDEQRARNRCAKQDLISEARGVAQYSTDWKATGDKLSVLMERWRAVGSAGRECDDALWGEFNGVRQDFFERRRVYYENRDREFRAKASAKSAIVTEASGIASSCDYS